MAVTKSNTQVHNSTTLTAGAGNTTSSSQDLTTAYGGEAVVKLTNGATGPTVPAQVQMQVSNDNSKFYNYGGLMIGLTSNNGVASWAIDIPIGVMYVQFVSGSNTGQNVTLDVDVSKVTAI